MSSCDITLLQGQVKFKVLYRNATDFIVKWGVMNLNTPLKQLTKENTTDLYKQNSFLIVEYVSPVLIVYHLRLYHQTDHVNNV